MKRATACLAMLATVAAAAPARGAVVEVSTSVSVEDATDQAKLDTALRAAVNELLAHATGFVPTVVVLTRAVVVGGRLYVRLMLSDESGSESSIGHLPPLGPDTQPASRPATPRTDI